MTGSTIFFQCQAEGSRAWLNWIGPPQPSTWNQSSLMAKMMIRNEAITKFGSAAPIVAKKTPT